MKIRDDIKLYAKLATAQVGYVSGQIEVTSKCYQHCKYCSSWRDTDYRHKELTLQQIQKIVQELLNDFPMFEHLTITGGDPQKWQWLDKFLLWWQVEKIDIDLQVSTALARDIKHPDLWRTTIKDFRVSLDALTAQTYTFIRGDHQNCPDTILTRLKELNHPNLAIIITIYPSTIKQLFPLLALLDTLQFKGLAIRKIIIMAGIGMELDRKFWDDWEQAQEFATNASVATSFTESIPETRKECESSVNQHVRCWASRLGFHIKPNGDVFPCCLVGGEAITVQKKFCMGNIFEQDLIDIYNSYTPTTYGMELTCREFCQYKQLCINLASDLADKTKLAIP